MGCCCSSENDNASQDGTVTERTRLLNGSEHNSYQTSTSPPDYGNPYSSSAPQKSDEQTALNRILQQIACDVIDVGALDYHNIETREYAERVLLYKQRINSMTLPHGFSRGEEEPKLLVDIASHEKVLAAQPLPISDLMLMNMASGKVTAAVENIRVEHREDLVVPFGNQ